MLYTVGFNPTSLYIHEKNVRVSCWIYTDTKIYIMSSISFNIPPTNRKKCWHLSFWVQSHITKQVLLLTIKGILITQCAQPKWHTLWVGHSEWHKIKQVRIDQWNTGTRNPAWYTMWNSALYTTSTRNPARDTTWMWNCERASDSIQYSSIKMPKRGYQYKHKKLTIY